MSDSSRQALRSTGKRSATNLAGTEARRGQRGAAACEAVSERNSRRAAARKLSRFPAASNVESLQAPSSEPSHASSRPATLCVRAALNSIGLQTSTPPSQSRSKVVSTRPVAGAVVLRCMVLLVPAITLLTVPPFPRRTALAIGGAMGLVALVLNGWFLAQHLERCGGGLRGVAPPAGWTALPVIARGERASLGSFSLRWTRLSYKGYPGPYAGAQLADSSLCFASSLSLAPWFGESGEELTHEPAMYRSVHELRLRHQPRLGVYVVSARTSEESPEHLVLAFRREREATWAFDSALSLMFFAMGFLTLTVGGYSAARWHTNRALLLLLSSAFAPFVYRATADVFDVVRPGHEVHEIHGLVQWRPAPSAYVRDPVSVGA